jgi:hypothetical protein
MEGKKKTTRRQLISGLAIGIAALIAVYALVVVSITPVKYDFAVGEVAPETITASRDVEDTVSTQKAIDAARQAVADNPPKMIDNGITQRVLSRIASYFEGMTEAYDTLRDAYIDAQVAANGGTYPYSYYSSRYNPAQNPWESFLSPEQMRYIREMLLAPDMSDSDVYSAARMTETDIETMRRTVAEAVTAALGSGVEADYLDSAVQDIRNELEATYSDMRRLNLAMVPAAEYLEANFVVDEDELALQQNKAEAAVTRVVYKKSQTVVTAGSVVTEAQLAVLKELGVVGGQETDYLLYVSMFVYTALLFLIYGIYLYQFERELLTDSRHLLILATITVVTAALAVPLVRFNEHIIPAFFGTMLVCVLISQRSALFFTVFFAFVTAPICAWNTGLFSVVALTAVMAATFGGEVCAFALHRPMHRTSLITAGLAAGAAGAVVAVLGELIGAATISTKTLAITSAYALGSGLLAGVLTIGTLPIWEAVFSASTPSKLLELSNPNHPLLKRLTLEAPGTYSHSILTANLAEAGADATGASALLCRVGAYYHDIGKLKDPAFFGENQKGDNPHDRLDPRESARIITGHVTCGAELARKYKLPREVQAIIAQHHGSTSVAYFAHKALEAGIEPKAAQFRYPGTRPVTREAAIVMLADCVEAAVRSMDDPDIAQIREMIGRLIRDRYNEGQLDDAPLSRQDLNRIAQAFMGVYEGALHERVKYPGQE